MHTLQAAAPPTDVAARRPQPRVALVLTSLRDSWNAQFAELCRDYALLHGIDLAVLGCNREAQVEWQESLVDTVAAEGFNGLILLPADATRLVRSCRQAVSDGVALVTVVNRLDPDEAASAGMTVPFVGSDDATAGRMLGAFLRTRFPTARRGLVLEAEEANQAAHRRVDGFLEGFRGQPQTEHAVTRILAHGQRDEAFLVTARAFADQAPGFVFAANDEMALGAADALSERNDASAPILLGIGNTDPAKARLRTRQMQATVDLRADQMAQAAISAMLLRLAGKTAPAVTETAPELVTYDSVGKRIWLLLYNQAEPFLAQLATGAKRQAVRHGMLLQTVDAMNDSVRQERQVHAVVESGSDFLMVAPLDAAALRHELQAAADRHVQIFIVGDARLQGVDTTSIGVDYTQAGHLAGSVLARLMRGKGSIMEVEGIPGTQMGKELSLGARQGTAGSAGIHWACRDSAYFDRGKARSVVTRQLGETQRIDGFFAHDPDMLLGASESCRAKAQRSYPVLVGFGYSQNAEVALRQGDIGALVFAPAERWGEICVDTAVRTCRGEFPGLFVPVDLRVLER